MWDFAIFMKWSETDNQISSLCLKKKKGKDFFILYIKLDYYVNRQKNALAIVQMAKGRCVMSL